MKKRASKKVANSLVAVSSAAVLAVYAAGYTRTKSAADQLEGQSAERRPAMPRPPRTMSPVAEFRPIPTGAPVVTASPAASTLPVEASKSVDKPTLVASVNPAPAKSSVSDTSAGPAVSDAPPVVPPVTAPAPAPLVLKPVKVEDDPYKALINAALPPWKDGTYEGWGSCRHGDLSVKVVIEGGKIKSAGIAECLTRYSCSIIDDLPPQVIDKQSPEVGYISGATQSTDAYYWAVVVALGKAK